MDENNKIITYQEMEDALEAMWFEDIITRNEYNIILDRLNKARGKE